MRHAITCNMLQVACNYNNNNNNNNKNNKNNNSNNNRQQQQATTTISTTGNNYNINNRQLQQQQQQRQQHATTTISTTTTGNFHFANVMEEDHREGAYYLCISHNNAMRSSVQGNDCIIRINGSSSAWSLGRLRVDWGG